MSRPGRDHPAHADIAAHRSMTLAQAGDAMARITRTGALLRFAADHHVEVAAQAVVEGLDDVDQLTEAERAEVAYRLLVGMTED